VPDPTLALAGSGRPRRRRGSLNLLELALEVERQVPGGEEGAVGLAGAEQLQALRPARLLLHPGQEAARLELGGVAQHGPPLLHHLRPVAVLQEVEPLEGSGRMASSLEQTAARSPTSPSSTAATLARLHPVYGGVDPAEPGELAAGLLPGPGRGPTHRAFSRAESSQDAAVSELREALPCSPR
jgi:hypothetical protein